MDPQANARLKAAVGEVTTGFGIEHREKPTEIRGAQPHRRAAASRGQSCTILKPPRARSRRSGRGLPGRGPSGRARRRRGCEPGLHQREATATPEPADGRLQRGNRSQRQLLRRGEHTAARRYRVVCAAAPGRGGLDIVSGRSRAWGPADENPRPASCKVSGRLRVCHSMRQQHANQRHGRCFLRRGSRLRTLLRRWDRPIGEAAKGGADDGYSARLPSTRQAGRGAAGATRVANWGRAARASRRGVCV